jgi:hypothetical protein
LKCNMSMSAYELHAKMGLFSGPTSCHAHNERPNNCAPSELLQVSP